MSVETTVNPQGCILTVVVWPEPILHVDMDSFFVEVERLRDPQLVGVPVAVGGPGNRGVVASASYEARQFGVHSAQPTSIARRLCPELVVVPSSLGRYSDVSTDVFAVFRSFTPLVEGLSLDEAFLDVSGLKMHFDSPVAIGHAIREIIRVEIGLPASVGVASVKFVAKLASEEAKPDGLTHIRSENQLAFLHQLRVQRLWGVGPATLAGLERLGVATIGDLAELDRQTLLTSVGESAGAHLFELAGGRDPRPVTADSASKSISVEETYSRDLISVDTVEAALLGQAQQLSGRLRRAGLRARTVTLKVRFSDFRTVSRSRTSADAIDGSRNLYLEALNLVDSVAVDEPVRLLGLGATSLISTSSPSQLSINSGDDWESVENAVAEVRERFGDDSVRPARLVSGPNPSKEGKEP